MRGFVTPGDLLTIEASVVHEGSGFAVTEAKVRVGGKLRCNADAHLRPYPLPQSGSARAHGRDGQAHRLSAAGADAMTETKSSNRRSRRKSGSPASASPPRSAKGWTRTGTRSTSGASMSTRRASRPTSCIPGRRSISTPRSRKRAISARWKPGSGSAPMPPGWRWIPPASRATRKSSARMDMIVAAGGGERDLAVDLAILQRRRPRAIRRPAFSTNG